MALHSDMMGRLRIIIRNVVFIYFLECTPASQLTAFSIDSKVEMVNASTRARAPVQTRPNTKPDEILLELI